VQWRPTIIVSINIHSSFQQHAYAIDVTSLSEEMEKVISVRVFHVNVSNVDHIVEPTVAVGLRFHNIAAIDYLGA
jgi:hypothetical protein